MAATRLGIPMPFHRDAPRSSGRYTVKAPDAPVGSVLRVTLRDGTEKFVEVACPHEKLVFVDLDSELVDFRNWDYATRMEVETFKFERRVRAYADVVDVHGVPSFAATIRGLPELERAMILRAVADVLVARDKGRKATQVLAFLWEESRQ